MLNTYRNTLNSFSLKFAFSLFFSLLLCFTPVQAHTPLFDCFDNGDGTIICEGGFSDGGISEGIVVQVVDAQGKVIAQKPMGKDNTVTFAKPNQEYSVIFAAGEGHDVTVFGDDIY